MNYETDNRYCVGASGADVPEDSPAAYGARWIDRGDYAMADIVPDRQGLAYNDVADRERLLTLMGNATDSLRIPRDVPRDECHQRVDMNDWQMYVRRAGGYIYVDAWLVTA